jgi:imidazolonepropionase-like amidohydrolase
MFKSKVFVLFFASLLIIPILAQKPAFSKQESVILIENVTLIDGTGREAVPGSFVMIEGNRIVKVSDHPIDAPPSAHRINGKGKFLIPGLMDVHIHLRGGRSFEVREGKYVQKEPNVREGIQALQSYLYCGVTSIFDAGNKAEFILGLREKERSGEIVSCRIFATGPICTYPGSHGGSPGGILVDDWPEGKAKLDEHIALKPDLAKLTYEEHGWGTRSLIPRFPVELMQEVVHYFNSHGIRTVCHISSELHARDAIYAGVDTLAHPVIQSPITESFAKLVACKKIPMVTTLTIGEGYSRLVEHPEFLDQPLYKSVLDPEEIKRLKTQEREKQEKRPWTWWMKIMTPIAQENLRMVNEAGGIVALGTDQSIGPAVHRELELLVGGGISTLDAIRIATLNAALFLGKEREMGSIEKGKLADMVLLTADPVADINNAKKIDMVIKDGQIIDRSNLDLPISAKSGS